MASRIDELRGRAGAPTTSAYLSSSERITSTLRQYTANLVPGEIFEIQERTASQVVAALDVTLLESERQLLTTNSAEIQEAYEYYQRGNEYRDRSFEE